MPDKDLPDFGAIVGPYERFAEPLTASFARRAWDLAEVPAGGRVIDVAAGPGVLALAAAKAGSPVLAVDLAPPMVARAAERLAAFPDCEARVASCDKLDVADADFDAAFSIFGVTLLPVWREGLAELVRVTRPGGVVAVSAWPHREGAKPMLVLKDTFTRLFPDREFGESPLKPWDATMLCDALVAAGCDDVQVQRVTATYTQGSAQDMVDFATPFFQFAPAVKDLGEDERALLRSALVEAFSAYVEADGVMRLPTEALVAVGHKRA